MHATALRLSGKPAGAVKRGLAADTGSAVLRPPDAQYFIVKQYIST
jgi:hypothetical protein